MGCVAGRDSLKNRYFKTLSPRGDGSRQTCRSTSGDDYISLIHH